VDRLFLNARRWYYPLRIFRSIKKLTHVNDGRFVEILAEHADVAVQALRLLHAPSSSTLKSDELAQIKSLELAGDALRRTFIDELMKTYATPFDREDLFSLSCVIDDVLDGANEAALELSTFGVNRTSTYSEIIDILIEGSEEIVRSLRNLLRDPKGAAQHAITAKRAENRVDALYNGALVDLFDGSQEFTATLKLREIYRHLKSLADKIDNAAAMILTILIKES